MSDKDNPNSQDPNASAEENDKQEESLKRARSIYDMDTIPFPHVENQAAPTPADSSSPPDNPPSLKPQQPARQFIPNDKQTMNPSPPQSQSSLEKTSQAPTSEALDREQIFLARDTIKYVLAEKKWTRVFLLISKLVFWIGLIATILAISKCSVSFGELEKIAYPSQFPSLQKENEYHIAQLDINGVIVSEAPANSFHFYQSLKQIKASAEDENVAGVVLNINSPGGSAAEADLMYGYLADFKQAYPDIPVYAVIREVGASGAYYLASVADRIYANPNSIVGSIGVIFSGYGLTELLKKIGVEDRTFKAGKYKDLGNPNRPLTKQEEQIIQDRLNQVHELFISRVKASRPILAGVPNDDDMWSGLYYTGVQAYELKLIDGFQSLYGTYEQEFAEDVPVVNYSRRKNDWTSYLEDFVKVFVDAFGLNAKPRVLMQ